MVSSQKGQAQLLTDREAACILRVETVMVRRLVERGELECFRFGEGEGAPWKVSRDQIRQYEYRKEV